MQLLSAEFKKFAKNPLHVHERSYGIPNSAINYQLNGKFRQPIPINATAFAFRHIVSPVSYLAKCYRRIMNCINNKAKNRATMCHVMNTFILCENSLNIGDISCFVNVSIFGILNSLPLFHFHQGQLGSNLATIAVPIGIITMMLYHFSMRHIVVIFFSKKLSMRSTCFSMRSTCFDMADTLSDIDFSERWKLSVKDFSMRIRSSFLATPSSCLFKVKTCTLADLGSTPPVTKSSYISNVVTFSIVNHLIKSVSNTISKLFQIVNTLLMSFVNKKIEHKSEQQYKQNKTFISRVSFVFWLTFARNFLTCIFTGFHALFLHHNGDQYTEKKPGYQIQRKTIKHPASACALTINRLTNLLGGFHKKPYLGNLEDMSNKIVSIYPAIPPIQPNPIPIQKDRPFIFEVKFAKLVLIDARLYFSANSKSAIFRSFLVTYSTLATCICSVFRNALISLKVLSLSSIMSKSPLDHLLTQLSHTLSPMSTREVLSWQ